MEHAFIYQDPLLFNQEDPALFTDIFKDASLDQLLSTVYSSPLSSPGSSASETLDSPRDSLPQDDGLLDELLSPTHTTDTNLLQLDAFDNFIQQATQSLTRSTTDFFTKQKPEAILEPVKSRANKKNQLQGQSTMSIKMIKPSNRPSRQLECFNCKVTKTPLWRRTPDRKYSLCNACGLYYKQYNHHRPLHVRNKTHTVRAHPYDRSLPLSITKPELASFAEQSVEISQECANCHQTQTPLWRKNERGEPLCNACGLYAKLRQRDRPVEMRKTTIQRRRRDCWVNNEEDEDHRFISLLTQMDRHQMVDFLDMLERRCHFLKTILNIS
ncbi:hypothetical protein G6F46_001282 [Rhizopus delemar]|nr:hypothetical protein G6F46_001282 [Rhizopus delemar]